MRHLAALGAVALLGLLCGCARPVGDLGRAAPDVVHDDLMPAIGAARARAAGEPVSAFNRTDPEREMADRIWRFTTSGHARDWVFDQNAEMQRTRVAAPPGKGFRIDRYYTWLHDTTYASSTVRYAALTADVEADTATLPALFAVICEVGTTDARRRLAAARLGSDPAGDANLVARLAENDRQVSRFVDALGYRYASYNYALDHLLVETPHPAARAADDALAALEPEVRRAERGDFCAAEGGRRPRAESSPAIPSRFIHGNPPRKPVPAGS
jgi:hypothetical protein